MLCFDGFDELDVVGPFEVLATAAAGGCPFEVGLAAESAGAELTGAHGLRLRADRSFVPGAAPLVVVPGGNWISRGRTGAYAEVARGEWPRLLAQAAARGSVLASVCTGALLLAHAGLLAGRRATTHHGARDDLAATGAQVVSDRVVDEGEVVTAGGVTSGLDLGLHLVARFALPDAARAVARALEHPYPPEGRRGDAPEPG